MNEILQQLQAEMLGLSDFNGISKMKFQEQMSILMDVWGFILDE